MKTIECGIKGTAEIKVSASELAANVGSGSLDVFATPAMIMLMEKAACICLADYLENDETTVGTAMNVQHISATPLGMTVSAEALLTEINGREFTFTVTACDEAEKIGEGVHKRFLVYGEKFMAKTNSK